MNKYFFYKRLVFGCRSSPKIFDMLSKAIFWILENNYNVKNVLHLLHDIITFDPPGEGELKTMAVLTMVFKKLGIPISQKKNSGSIHSDRISRYYTWFREKGKSYFPWKSRKYINSQIMYKMGTSKRLGQLQLCGTYNSSWQIIY